MKIKLQVNKSTSVMGNLLASHKNSFVPLHKGESVKGTITKLTSSEILVDVGAKTEGVVLEKDRAILHTLLSNFKVGDSIEVHVLSPESDTGQPIVSMRRYLGNLAWKKLEKLIESRELIEAKVDEAGKAGYVLSTLFGVSGFLPQSQISYSSNKTISIGDKISVMVLELSRKDNKIIFSQKPVFSDKDFAKLISKFKEGQKVEAIVISVASFGLFVSLPVIGENIPLEGFIHLSEVSWDKIVDLSNLYVSGQKIAAVILKLDNEARKIQLSIKRLSKDPFEAVAASYPLDMKITGKVTKVAEGGIDVEIGNSVEGFIRADKIPPTVTYVLGQKLTVLVSEYDKRRKRIYLVPVLLEKPIGYR